MSAQPETHNTPTLCPYLGVEGHNHRLGEAVEYPSFENRCWTTPRPIPLLLTDQATLCLCNGYLHCPRFLAARAARQGQERPATVPPPADNDAISSAIKELEADVQAATVTEARSRRRWGWIGAGLIFMSSLLCGGLFAAYVGWQMVRDELATTPPGNVDTLAPSAQAQANLQSQTYIIVTATSAPQTANTAQAPAPLLSQALGQQAANGVAAGTQQQYPEAVAPTSTPFGYTPQPPPSLADIAQQTNATAIAPQTQPTAILDFDLEVPTRRPTPVLDIPTSTPAADASPTPAPTATPVPPLGTPFVIFYTEDKVIEPGDCTTVYWHVENVKAVYYENTGVDGRGDKEECARDDSDRFKDYNLMVILPNGATEWYTVTVGVVAPTNTPAPTPTRAVEPEPTPTWTPNIPTPTPTRPVNYNVRLEASGDTNLSCRRGTSCEVDFYVSNSGDALDNITIRFTEAASWPRQICRLDGVCSESQLTVVDIGPSSTGVVRLRITVPQDAPAETMIYRLQAVSDKSNGTATSSIVSVQVSATGE